MRATFGKTNAWMDVKYQPSSNCIRPSLEMFSIYKRIPNGQLQVCTRTKKTKIPWPIDWLGLKAEGPSQISLEPLVLVVSTTHCHEVLYLAVRDALAERITLGLADGCVQVWFGIKSFAESDAWTGSCFMLFLSASELWWVKEVECAFEGCCV